MDQDTREEMIEKVLRNCWNTAVDIYNDEKLNPNKVFLQTQLKEYVNRRAFECISTSIVIPLESEPNK